MLSEPEEEPSKIKRIRRLIIGPPRDVSDPQIFHHVSLIAFFAWVGLGADGLSSSAYGPEEAYKALGTHYHLSILLVAMTTVTITVIAIAYSNLIQHFPGGGGGYLVASKLLGNRVGVVSGCALLVDYVLTITVSIASACDQIWSFLPPHLAVYKLTAELALIAILIILNLRGVRESVSILTPVFLLFIVTHVVAIFYAIGSHLTALPAVFRDASSDFHTSVQTLRWGPLALLLLRAYSLGGGTYTGIEAVSNGVTMLREPRVRTGKRTMALMAFSLAFTAGGILFGYLLTRSTPVAGKTMNAVLLEHLFGSWHIGGTGIGTALVVISLAAEGLLLVVAAQAGFLDGPRVLANMAVDSWMPHRFSQLSDRLVTKNGIYLMGLAAIAALVYTRGDIATLVVMYSINVFITFSLTELGMARHWIKDRAKEPRWKSQLAIHGTGLVMCVSILVVIVFEKFAQGGWITVVVTSVVIGFAFWVHSHYQDIKEGLKRLDDILTTVPLPKHIEPAEPSELDPNAPTAVISVASFSGFGLHQILSIHKSFPGYFKQFLFVSAAVVDSGTFKGAEELERLEETTEEHLQKYIAWTQANRLKADYRMAVGTEAVATIEDLCLALAEEYPRAIFFMGRLISAKRSGITACCTTRRRTRFSGGCSSRAFRRWCFRSGCCEAARPCCTCAHAVAHCSTTLLHVRPCRGTLQHDPAARAPMPWRIAARPCCTCSHGVAHCTTTLPHVRPCRGALHHHPAARAAMAWRIAPRPCCTCAHAVAHCTTTLPHVRPCLDTAVPKLAAS